LREETRRRDRIELDVFFEIEVSVKWCDAAVFEINVAAVIRGIVPKYGRGRAPNERRDFLKHARPQRSIERRIVDIADQ
jgi:hypothetical protein